MTNCKIENLLHSHILQTYDLLELRQLIAVYGIHQLALTCGATGAFANDSVAIHAFSTIAVERLHRDRLLGTEKGKNLLAAFQVLVCIEHLLASLNATNGGFLYKTREVALGHSY